MANHQITFTVDDAAYRELIARQESEGKAFSVDGKPISVDVFAKDITLRYLDPNSNWIKTING